MYTQLEIDEATTLSRVSTGHLPPDEEVAALVAAAYERYKSLDEGEVADYIPARAILAAPHVGGAPRGRGPSQDALPPITRQGQRVSLISIKFAYRKTSPK